MTSQQPWRAPTPPRASSPRHIDIAKLYYDEQATEVRRERGSSTSSAHRAIAPFTPRINDGGSRSSRSGDVFSTLYEIGLDKKRQALEAARVSALNEHDKMWASYRASPSRGYSRQPWDNACTKVGSAHTPRSTTPTRSAWTTRSASELRKHEEERRKGMLKTREPAPSILRSTQSSLNKEWPLSKESQASSRTPSRAATPVGYRRDNLSTTFERLSRPRTAARPVLESKKSASTKSTPKSSVASAHRVEVQASMKAASPSEKPLYISTSHHNEPTEESHGTPHFEAESSTFDHTNEPAAEQPAPHHGALKPATASPEPVAAKPTRSVKPATVHTNAQTSPAGESAALARANSRRRVIDDLKIDSDDDSPLAPKSNAADKQQTTPTSENGRARGAKPLSAIVKQLESV
jgi:hypothetical protein